LCHIDRELLVLVIDRRPNISSMTLLCSLFSEFTTAMQAVPVGNMLPMRCHKKKGDVLDPGRPMHSPLLPRR
jgi:hypothetical protein